MHVYLIGTYRNSIKQQQPDGDIIRNNVSMTCMKMIDPDKGWFKIVEILTYDLNEVTAGNDEYIYKSFVRVSQLFNKTCIFRYPHPRNVVFDNVYEFKRDFTTLLNDLNLKHVLTTIKTPQANTPVERVHQVILNLLVTKYIYNKVFDHIYPWGETLAYIAWSIIASYHRTIMATPGQAVFGRDMLYNLASVVDWLVVTFAKQRQVDIDNVRENAKRVTYDYAIGN